MGRRPRPSSRYSSYSVATVSIFATVKPTFLAHAPGQGPCGLGPVSATEYQGNPRTGPSNNVVIVTFLLEVVAWYSAVKSTRSMVG
jgi:hypothetical protein